MRTLCLSTLNRSKISLITQNLTALQSIMTQDRHYRRRIHISQAASDQSEQPTTSTETPSFTVVSEEPVFSRYITLYDRKIQFPSLHPGQEGPIHAFDVIGHPRANFHFCVIFPFHPAPSGSWKDGTVTLVREFAQGPAEMVYVLPTGGFDPKKHSDYEACARAELSEEALLTGGSLHRLITNEIPEVKWCRNKFTPFICIDPVPDEQPGTRDAEEQLLEVLEVSIPELKSIMKSGEMLLPSVTTCWWAFEYLEELEERLLLNKE